MCCFWVIMFHGVASEMRGKKLQYFPFIRPVEERSVPVTAIAVVAPLSQLRRR